MRDDYNEFLQKLKPFAETKGLTSLDLEAIFESIPTSLLQGTGKVPYLKEKPEKVENGMMWMEADRLHIWYNNAEKIVSGSWPLSIIMLECINDSSCWQQTGSHLH